MTGYEFKDLSVGDMVKIDNDEYIYTVLATDDHMGRIQMQAVEYYVDYDNYEYCFDTCAGAIEFIDNIEYDDCDTMISEMDIERRISGKPFWMDYRQVYIHD